MTDININKENMEKKITQSEDLSRTIILCGSKSVGKSSLLHSFLEKSEMVRETLVLEYSFGRKSSQGPGMEKSVCHVWEYGGKLEILKNVLTHIPSQGKLFYCVMIDLSKLKSLWNTLDLCLQAMKENYMEIGIPEFIIIGGKYDLFKNYDSELKKLICVTLRSVALVCDAHLFFYSSKDSQLARKSKEVFYQMGFGSGVPRKEKLTHYTKPLFIQKGSDSWDQIGTSPSTFEEIKMRFISRVGNEAQLQAQIKKLPRTHPEPILDSLVALKYEELRNIESFDPAIDEYLSLYHV